MDFKNIHIGKMVEKRVKETNTDGTRICKFLKCTDEEIKQMYASRSIETEILLKWSKLLEYDFFRIYSQHLLLYTSSHKEKNSPKTKDISTTLPEFRKNIYTKEIIEFILELVKSGEKTRQDIIDTYHIPKTTLYKWFSKYNSEQNGSED
ncbi:transposase [Chryseobacterium luquanense]|uniref:Transposase n=1 Tax=Chryseobacterium luquanense TaxID=2983766 RepID=A0ABT3Y4D9_9FLAO|nr:transposase [Chryseobacterium luquanense]MCX8533019.1 transposase [Chryseobacterium luquanense]